MTVRTEKADGASRLPSRGQQSYFFGEGTESIVADLGNYVQRSESEPCTQSGDYQTTCEFMQKEKTIHNIPPGNATMG